MTTQDLVDALDAAIAALLADPTAEYTVGTRTWKAHDLPALINARGKLLSQLADEGGTFYLGEICDQ